MPNGGIPMHMVLHPRDGDVVIHCQGGEMRIISKDEWGRDGVKAATICTLSNPEGAALAWHLRYWLGEAALKPGYRMGSEVQAEYDF